MESEESKARAVAVVHAESLCPGSHIISVQISICHSRSETLVRPVLPHPAAPDARLQMQLFHYFPPLVAPRSRLRSLSCASQSTDVRLHIHSVHSRKAESLVNWYAPFYPLHRPGNVSQRGDLTSSRLDLSEQGHISLLDGVCIFFNYVQQ